MAVDNRVSFVFINRPPIFFEKVEGAEMYSFALSKKELDSVSAGNIPNSSIWIKQVCANELNSSCSNYPDPVPGYLYFEYPEGEVDLENLVTYIIIATAQTMNGIKTAQGEIIVLEKEISDMYGNVYKQIQDSQNKNLAHQYDVLSNKILGSSVQTIAPLGGPTKWGPLGCPKYLYFS